MRALVLGGCGFIGSHVTESLVARGYDVRVFGRPNVDRRNLAGVEGLFRFIPGDFLRQADVKRAREDNDVVFHLIGSTVPGNSLASPAFEMQSIVGASVNLLAECVAAGVEKVGFVSSGGTVWFLGVFLHQYGLDHAILRLANPLASGNGRDRGRESLVTGSTRSGGRPDRTVG